MSGNTREDVFALSAPEYHVSRLGPGQSVDRAARLADRLFHSSGRMRAAVNGRAVPWIEGRVSFESEASRRLAVEPCEELEAFICRAETAGGFSRYVRVAGRETANQREGRRLVTAARSVHYQAIAAAIATGRVLAFSNVGAGWRFVHEISIDAWRVGVLTDKTHWMFVFTADLELSTVEAEAKLLNSDVDIRTPTRPAPGRPKGSGDLAASDRFLIEKMAEMIGAEPALSPTAAAKRLAKQAVGGGTEDSKARRLARRYRGIYS